MSHENRLLSSVHTVTRLLSQSVNPDGALRLMLEAAIQAVDAIGGSILLHDAEKKQLWFSLVLGGEAQGTHLAAGFGLYGVSIRDDEGIAGQVFQSLTPHIENKTSANPQHARRIDEEFDFETRSLITVPLIYPGGQPFGVMQLVNKKDGDFTDEDLIVIDIVANISALNVHNANLANEARRTKALDYLGRVIHDVTNKVSQLAAPLESLAESQDSALEALNAADETRAELHERIVNIKAGISDLLRYTEFMTGAVEGQPITVQRVLGDLIATTERQLNLLQSVVESRGVSLVRDYDAASNIVFPFDSFLIERAIYNLVNNALKATNAGGTITVKVFEEGDSAVLTVQDTGFGIQPNVLSRILSGTASGGTGLSTSIVREVAEMHGGALEGDSTPGSGTIFRVRLPIIVAE
jgi:signal transduction histidine kinase